MKLDWDVWNAIMVGACLGAVALGIVLLSGTNITWLNTLAEPLGLLPVVLAASFGLFAWVRNRLNGS